MDSFDKKNIGNLRPWKPGDGFVAKHLDETRQALANFIAPNVSKQIDDTPLRVQFRMFKVLRLEKDVVICNFFDGTTAGEDEVKVAIPYLIRFTPFDFLTDNTVPRRNDIKYEYSFTDPDTGLFRFDKRTGFKTADDPDDDDDEEIQVIVPSYTEGDIIFGIAGIAGGNGVFHDEDKTMPVVWLDMNQARHWALSDEDEEDDE